MTKICRLFTSDGEPFIRPGSHEPVELMLSAASVLNTIMIPYHCGASASLMVLPFDKVYEDDREAGYVSRYALGGLL